MHGVIFQSFRDYLVAEHGRDVVQSVFAGEPEYLLNEAYPDAALIRLIGAAAAAAARDVDEIVYGLGVYTAETTFSRLYPAFFDQTPTPRAFLLTVEEHIHELIRATIPRRARRGSRSRRSGRTGSGSSTRRRGGSVCCYAG
jgi:heme-NO-binding protein